MRLYCKCKNCHNKMTISQKFSTQDQVKDELGELFMLTCRVCRHTRAYQTPEICSEVGRYFFFILPGIFIFILIIFMIGGVNNIKFLLYTGGIIFASTPLMLYLYMKYDNKEYNKITHFKSGITSKNLKSNYLTTDDRNIDMQWFNRNIAPSITQYLIKKDTNNYDRFLSTYQMYSIDTYDCHLCWRETNVTTLEIIDKETNIFIMNIELSNHDGNARTIEAYEIFRDAIIRCTSIKKIENDYEILL